MIWDEKKLERCALSNESLRSHFYMLYLTHGNILATVHQKANGNYVIEIKIRHIARKTLINSVKFWHDGAEFE